MENTNIFPALRKKNNAMDECEAWSLLGSAAIEYGFLGVSGFGGDGGYAYVVPMNFAADADRREIYFHTTMDADSRMARTLAANPRACFSVVSPESHIAPGPEGMPACMSTMHFESVIVFGDVAEVAEREDKLRILDLMMAQKTPNLKHAGMVPQIVDVTRIFAMAVRHISGARKK